MEIIRTPQEMHALVAGWRCSGQTVGFAPTMGALHEGHLSLVRQARRDADFAVASIYVNPTQFGPNEDYNRYPQSFERDCQLLAEAGCDALFAPDTSAMYSDEELTHGPHTYVEVGRLGEVWEGVVRPGHLRGVATIVTKLFNIVAPDLAYFGEKDYQQLKVIEHLVRDLHFPIRIVPMPTLREPDGLAMSSRNAYLNPAQRQKATVLYRAMMAGVEAARAGETDVRQVGRAVEAVCAAEPDISVQYVAIVDAATLAPLERLDTEPARILIAARVGETRLIDNVAL